MLTDLSWLAPGKPFPPPEESERLQMYQENRRLFESDHARVYEAAFRRITRVIGNYSEIVSYPVILNYHKLLSLKIADLLFGESPKFSATNMEGLKKILDESDLINTCYMVAIDVSRYGDGLLQLNSRNTLDLVQPSIWFPVCNPDDVQEILYHVLAWRIGDKILKVRIHYKGGFDEREYSLIKSLSGYTIGNLLKEKTTPTNLDAMELIQIPNVLTSDRCTGIDDYTDIDSILSELMVRIAQVSRILDKHADPSMYGPADALEKDPKSGEWRMKSGRYFPIGSKEDAVPGYVTWDAQLEANFKAIDLLLDQLHTLSEMGSALLGNLSDTQGNIASGSALRRLMVSPLAKVNRIRMRFDAGLKEAIKLCGKIRGIDLDDIAITWQDGLPGDPTEEAAIIYSRTGGRATMSLRRALKNYDGLSDEQIEKELVEIADQEAEYSPQTDLVIPEEE